MCFGSSQVSTSTSTPTPNSTVAGAATQNLGFAQNLESTGFSPYTGQQVANFSPLQQQSFNSTAAGTANAPNYLDSAGNLFGNVATSGLPTVNAGTISGAMSPYMNQYVNLSLQPQLQSMQQQFAGQDQQLNAAATSSGAFGDARAGIQAANLTQQQNIAQQGLVGNAYNAAFNTAIGAGAQDVSNSLQAQTTNAGLAQAQLQNQMQAGGALENLGMGGIGLQNSMGQQQTAQSQAQLNAQYNQWLMGQQYPFQTAELLNQSIGTGAQAMPASTTTVGSAPNNSGYAMLGAMFPALFNGGSSGFSGSVAGQGLNWLTGSDERIKADKKKVGKTDDGQNLYSFRYVWEEPGTTHVGLMAQEVEKVRPDAVWDIGGVKYVDYNRALGLDNVFGTA